MSDFSNDPRKKPSSAFSVGSSAEDDMDEMDEVDEIGEYVQSGRMMSETQDEEKKNPYNNPKNHIITAALLLVMMLLLLFTESIKRGIEQNTAAQNGLIDLITLSDSSFLSEGGEVGYYTLAGGKLYEAEAFESGSSQRFVSKLYRHESGSDDARRNFVTDKSVYPDGDLDEYADIKVAENDPVFERILTLIEQVETEHSIFYARIFRIEGEYFVCVDRNVNLWTPYVLYYYSAENDTLYHLYTLSDMDIVDIRLGENFDEKINVLLDAQ